MAPPQTSRLPTMPAMPTSTQRTTSRNPNAGRKSPRDIKSPPSPRQKLTEDVPPLTPQLTIESEVDLESETDLPTMTPPSTKQLPIRPRDASQSTHTTTNNSLMNNSLATIMPQMQRAYSSPGVDSSGHVATPAYSYPRRPASPLSSGRRRSPLRSAFEEAYPGSSWSSLSIEPNIPEHAELEISTPITPENEFGNISAMPTYTNISNTFPRSRRRPASPLHQSASAPSLHTSARAASLQAAGGTPPSFSVLSNTKFANEPYPLYGYSLSSASSMPSTPTSLRSRSPSISSLETIEDTPDAEEAARLEEETTKSRTGDEIEGSVEMKRRSLDIRAASLRSNKDRKRWSVCGAERRADFSLEVIEE